ncbi:MAG: hypothetical protein AB1752_04935 [Candidatus Zixiibacteriota bacterium]
MAEVIIPQADADALLAMEKRRENDDQYDYPGLGGAIAVPVVSMDKRERFTLDVRRGSIDLLKGTYQTRARHVVVLARLDFGGAPHRNPDDEEIASPHLHVYKEGYGTKWAIPLPKDKFPIPADLWHLLEDFFAFCNITSPPIIRRGLFE